MFWDTLPYPSEQNSLVRNLVYPLLGARAKRTSLMQAQLDAVLEVVDQL